MTANAPKRRTERLVVRDVAGESVVYDLDTDTVHALPEQTARLWAAADGTRSIDQLRLLAGLSEQEALAVLAGLEDKGLMQSGTAGVSRRTVLQAAAVGAGALAIGSVAVPANAQTIQSVCIDQNPLDGGSLCETIKTFFNEILAGTRPGLEFPPADAPGTCTDGGDSVGVFDPRCPGYQIFYKETNADNWPAIGNLKTEFALCRWPLGTPPAGGDPGKYDGAPYIRMKGAQQGQGFPVFQPGGNNVAPPTCGCIDSCGGIKIDLPNSNSFIFGFQLPTLPPGSPSYYVRVSLCYPAAVGAPQPLISVNSGVVDPNNANVSWGTPLLGFTPIAGGTCTSRCFMLNPSAPLIGFWFKNPNQQQATTPVWIDAAVSTTACP
jgi:hypothetical protein